MQILSILIIVALRFLHFVHGQIPSVICSYSGTTDYQLRSKDQIPKGCGAIMYGHYYLDNGTQILGPELAALDLVHSMGLLTFVQVTFLKFPRWYPIIDEMSEDKPGKNYTQWIKPMVDNFIKVHKINGVILSDLGLFNSADNVQPDYATKMTYFIKQLKIDAPKILVGLVLLANQYDSFTNEQLFNFTTANSNVDIYVIDMTPTELKCDAGVKDTGRYPTSNSSLSQDTINAAVAKSTMAKHKIMINFVIRVSVRLSNNTHLKKDPNDLTDILYTSYTDADHAKLHYTAMMLSYIDYDDFSYTCNCGPFPITKSYMGGWTSQDPPTCPDI